MDSIIIDNYFNERINSLEQYRGTFEDEKIDKLKDFLMIIKGRASLLVNEGLLVDMSLEEIKKLFKDAIIESLKVREIEDKQERFKTVVIIHQLADFKYENPNSLEALSDVSNDMGLSIIEYILEAAKFASETLKNENDMGRSR